MPISASPSLLRAAADPEAIRSAFEEAAEAASSLLPGVERHVSRLLVSKGGGLSSLDIRRLSSVLLPYPVPNEHCRSPPPDPSPKASQVISGKKRGVTKWYKCLLRVADAALCKLNRQTGLHYELHTIYGESLLEDEDYNEYLFPHQFHCAAKGGSSSQF